MARPFAGAAFSGPESGINFFADPQNLQLNALLQVVCALNDSTTSTNPMNTNDRGTFTLNGVAQQIYGPGTPVAWQTMTNQAGLCNTPFNGTPHYSTDYGGVLQSGIGSGGTFLEVEPDVAFTNLAHCGPDLAFAVTQIQAATAAAPPCAYPPSN